MRLPVTLVTGVHADAMAVLTVALQWDLPRAVAVRHIIHVERQVLERVVSDVTGVVEHEELDLEHACVPCAVRADVLPTLERLAASGRWRSVVAHLPLGAGADQVCRVLADRPAGRRLEVTGVVAAVDGATVEADLAGDDLLCERGWHSATEDRRGVAEVLAGMIEYADVTVLAGRRTATGSALAGALARPGARVLDDVAELDASALVDGGWHRLEDTLSWVGPDRRMTLPPMSAPGVWRADLRSDRPFHPERLLEDIALLGGGPHRSRGCFHLPTRPGILGAWDGAGGLLSIGADGSWGRRSPQTRVVLTGVGSRPNGLDEAFESLLVTTRELSGRGPFWEVQEDGLEPWMGPVRRIA